MVVNVTFHHSKHSRGLFQPPEKTFLNYSQRRPIVYTRNRYSDLNRSNRLLHLGVTISRFFVVVVVGMLFLLFLHGKKWNKWYTMSGVACYDFGIDSNRMAINLLTDTKGIYSAAAHQNGRRNSTKSEKHTNRLECSGCVWA